MSNSKTSAHFEQNSKKASEAVKTDRLHDVVTSAQDSVETAADAVKETTNKLAKTAADNAQTFQGELDSAVRRNPTLAVLGAAGIGVLLGIALNRRA